jgi:hypothetical protein
VFARHRERVCSRKSLRALAESADTELGDPPQCERERGEMSAISFKGESFVGIGNLMTWLALSSFLPFFILSHFVLGR